MKRVSVIVTLLAMLCLALPAGATQEGQEEFDQLLAPDGRGGDRFGYSVAVDGDRIVIGAPQDRVDDHKVGSVYVFTRFGLGWKVDHLFMSRPVTRAEYLTGRLVGYSVDVKGDRIVVGAPDAYVTGQESGVVLVYDLVDGEWVETELPQEGVEPRDRIGVEVVLSEDGHRILAGSLKTGGYYLTGKAWLYEEVDGEWTSHLFEPSDGGKPDRFGSTGGLGEDFVVIGSPRHNGDRGAVYFYQQQGEDWIESKVVAEDAAWGTYFGLSVGVFGDTVLVGTADRDTVVTLERDGDSWIQEATAIAEEGTPDDEAEEPAGYGVSQRGNLLYSSYFGPGGPRYRTGAVRVLEETNAGWVEIDRYEGSDLEVGEGFGWGIALDDDVLVITALFHKPNGEATGAAYVKGMGPACGEWEPTIVGTEGDDELWGTDGDDVIVTGSGNDLIHVTAGQDVYCLEGGYYRFTAPFTTVSSGSEGYRILVTHQVQPDWGTPKAD